MESRATVLWTRKLARDYSTGAPSESEEAVFQRALRLFGVTRERLQAAFDAMTKHYDSSTAYLRDEIGLTDRDLVALQSWYLED